MVLVAHFPKGHDGVISRLLNFGWTGVDLFFVLSGYLIGSQLLNPMAQGKEVRLSSFYLRRLLRTLPAYYVVLAVYILTAYPGWRFLVFAQNFRMPPVFTPSWSLCVEEQFYLLFPIAALLLFRHAPKAPLLYGLAVFLGLELAVRSAIWFQWRPDLLPEPQALNTYMGYLYYPTWCRLDGIALGVSLAALKAFHPELWRRLLDRGNQLLTASAALLALAVICFWKHYSFLCSTAGFTALDLSFALLVAAALSRRCLLAGVRIPGAQPLALASYSVYLTHSLAMEVVKRVMELEHSSVQSVMGMGLTAVVISLFATTLYLGVERPSLVVRDRLLAARATPPGPVRTIEPVSRFSTLRS
jgi:peptidoglycan/LPS O-acetylase OafA/YrhL